LDLAHQHLFVQITLNHLEQLHLKQLHLKRWKYNTNKGLTI
jgi:hypothetical protein